MKLRPEDIRNRMVSNMSFVGLLTETVPPLIVRGLYGGDDMINGVCVDGHILNRTPYDTVTGEPEESTDQLRIRAARELVPVLSESVPRDQRGCPIGYFIYEGLDQDHCRPR
jgi:hypothetical protein